MSEADWEACADLDAMLESLRAAGRLTTRKGYLLAAACCRRVWQLLRDERSRTAVEVAERHADGLADQEEMREAYYAAEDAANELSEAAGWVDHAALAASWAAEGTASAAAANARAAVARHAGLGTLVGPEGAEQCRLARCIFGQPTRPPVLDPGWLAWGRGLVVELAEAAYQERELPTGTLDRARLAVLADALTDAGCTDGGLLGHLRGRGPHVRGCFVLDLILSHRS